MPYGPWTKAQTTAKILKQQRDRGKRNAAVQNQRRNSQSPPSSSKSKATEVQAPTRNETPDLDIRATRNQKILIPEELSMKVGNEKGARSESCQRLRELASEVNINRGTELETANAEEKEKERDPKKLQEKLNLAMKEICGGKIERDTESPSLNTNEGKNERVANGLKAPMANPKHRKWKMQARQDNKSGEKRG